MAHPNRFAPASVIAAGDLRRSPIAVTNAMMRTPIQPRSFAVLALAWSAGVLSHSPIAAAAEIELAEPILCTSTSDLSSRVSRALGQAFEQVVGPSFSIGLRSDATGFQARLEVAGDAATAPRLRTFRASTCEELTEALALAIALALQSTSERGDTATSGVPKTAASTSPAAVADVAPPLDAAEPSSEEPGPALGVRAAFVADTGSLPRPALGAAAGARLAWAAFELSAEALLLPKSGGSVDTGDPTSPGAELGLVTGALLACVPLQTGASAIQVSGCAGAELGRLWGTGTRVAAPHTKLAWWSAARVDLDAEWALSTTPFALGLTVTAAAPLIRDDFVLKDIGSVHQPASVVGRASLGMRWRFD